MVLFQFQFPLERSRLRRHEIPFRVARCHDISPSLLFLWRRQAAAAMKNTESKVRGGPAFVPMVVAGGAPAAAVANEACEIEVDLGDVRIRIKGLVDRSVLREVFLAARTTR
jgi:transposase